jgi:hypothetical protein
VGHFKPSKKPKEAGGATRCGDCNYAKECVWEAKKIYVDPLSQVEDSQRVSRVFLFVLYSLPYVFSSTSIYALFPFSLWCSSNTGGVEKDRRNEERLKGD